MNRIHHFLAAILLSQAALHAQLPAFPGAEGFGSTATGGRGGDVYYVTNRNASGAGSFAYGVQNAPAAGRTIVFAVSGHIRLPSGSGGGLTIDRDKITVAGQTAPGDGICFWNNTMNLTGDDLVLRHLRWRYGYSAAGGDSVDIANSERIIFDHCDVMFSTDENLSSFGTPPEFFTFQWSVNAWGLNGHSCGGLWDINHATAHHTLWANNHTRNPKCISPSVFDWVNNTTFGWDNGFNMAASTDPIARVNIRGSYFIHGGNTTEAVYGGGLNTSGDNIFKLHMSDSALDGTANGVLDVNRTNHGMVSSSQYDQAATAWPQTIDGVSGGPVIGTPVTVDPRTTAHKKVLSMAGATRMEIGTRPLRDEITRLCVDRTAAMQRGIISNPLELNLSTGTAFADLQSTAAPVDTDLDGMPDDWEDAVGYNKATADNNTVLTTPQTAASFFPAGSPAGYTRLEEYLHFMAVPHGTVARNTAASPGYIDIDLRKFTSGFTASPVFTCSNIIGGSITQSGPGNAVVRFTPPVETSGRAGFNFTVTDSAGDTWTQQCCLLVSTKTQPRPVTWSGDATTNNWDSVTANFASNLGPTAFSNGDAVTISDSGSNTPTLKVVGSLAPASLTVSNTAKNFTLQGTGSLSATDRFTKSGTGTLAISNTGPNTFTAATLEAGTLSLTTANALGSAPITFTGGTLAFSADQANALVIDGTVAVNPSGGRTMNGAWSGSGTINLTNTGSNLLTLGGSMANFTGDVSFGASTGSVRLYGNTGSANTAFNLGTATVLLFTRNGGSPFNLGSLTGASGTTLSGASSTTTVTNYFIGVLGTSTTFAGRIIDGGQGLTALTKTGSGTLTLTGNSTHSGPTAVNDGSLELLGTFGTSPVTVAANATLSGTGAMGGSLATAAGGIISPGASDGTAAGTLTAATLNLVSPTLEFDLSSAPATGNDRITVSNNGTVALAGTLNFIFHLTDGILSPGTYDLITTTGSVTAGEATLVSNLPTGTRQTLALETHAGGVRLVVTGNQGNLTWTGANGALWDQQTTASWSGASPSTFFNFDRVSFTDSASNGTVTITQPVAPHSITVNNTAARPYTITGAPITGTTSLVKSGTGSLTLNLPRYDLENCSITTGSQIVTVSDTTGLVPGMTAISKSTPALIPVGTTIVSVDNATTVTLSQNATATSTTARIIFETRNTFGGGTILNDGSLTLASNSWEYYSSLFPPPSNPFGLGTGPITLNGGTLTLLGHTVSTLHVSGALPNDLIVPAGKTATLRSVMRGTYLNDIAGLRGNLTGSGTLNLVVNYAYSAITGDWSGFSGTLNVTRPTGANDPRFQLGNGLGLPLANLSLDQVTLSHTATPPPEGVVIPIGSLAGSDASTTIIAGAQTGSAPITWQVGSLNTSTTFAGNFTPYGSAPIGLAKTGTGTWTLTGTGTVSAGITIAQGTLSYGDASTDTLSGTSEISIDPAATLQLNSGARIIGSSCEIFTGGTLRGTGTLQSPITSSGTLAVIGGTLTLIGDADLGGVLEFASFTDRLAVTGNLSLAGTIKLPITGATAGRHLLATYTGTLGPGALTIENIPANHLATVDTATAGEIAVVLVDQSIYQAWRILHFTTLGNPDGQPAADPDGDGMINQEEFEAGTDPNSDASFIPLVWQGGGTNPWDLATTVNWLENTTPRVFRDLRDVIINDTGSNSPAINLTGSPAPGSITVSNSTKAFTLSGSGSLTGTTGLVKSGTQTLTLSTSNTFSGATAVNAGVLALQHANALGSISGGTTVATNARLEIEGGITVTGELLVLSGTGGASFYNGALNSKSGTNTWSGPLTFATSGTRIGAQAGATLIVSGPISSSTGITIRPNDMTSTVVLSGANSYSGDTSVIGGVLKLGAASALPVATALKLGASNVSGKCDLGGCNQEVAGIAVTQTSGTYANEITSATPAILTVNISTNATYSGKLTGGLTLAKSGTATLSLTSSTALATTTTVQIDNGILNLTATHTVTALRLNGVWKTAGTYNSTNSSGRIAGAGSLIVTTSGPAGFGAWIDTFPGLSAAEKLPTADPDHDGVNNLLEYVLNGIPNSANPDILPTPSLTATHFVFTFTRREDSASTTTQIFEYGTALGTWIPVNITTPTGSEVALGPLSGGLRTITVNIPRATAPDGKLFGRLKVTQP